MNRFVFEIVAAALTFIFLAVVSVLIGTALKTNRECLALGYPQAKISYALEAYCIKRVDQTDIVVRIEQARKKN